jgi:hypothetical protein
MPTSKTSKIKIDRDETTKKTSPKRGSVAKRGSVKRVAAPSEKRVSARKPKSSARKSTTSARKTSAAKRPAKKAASKRRSKRG